MSNNKRHVNFFTYSSCILKWFSFGPWKEMLIPSAPTGVYSVRQFLATMCPWQHTPMRFFLPLEQNGLVLYGLWSGTLFAVCKVMVVQIHLWHKTNRQTAKFDMSPARVRPNITRTSYYLKFCSYITILANRCLSCLIRRLF